MARFLTSRKDLIGVSPDDLKLQGEKKIDFVRIRLFNYNAEHLAEKEVKSIGELHVHIKPETTSWINIDGLHEDDIVQQVSTQLNVDKLILNEVLNTQSRPRIHDYDSHIYISTKMLRHDAHGKIISENLSLVFNTDTLLSFQEVVGDVFNPIRERLRHHKIRIRSTKADFLAFALLDIVIDNYIHILSGIGEKIEELDSELIRNPNSSSLEKINKYKMEINYLRKTIKPCREMVLTFCKMDSDIISDTLHNHLNELRSNIELANDSLDSYREILSDQLNVFHTNMANKLNDVLKLLTLFSVVFIPITFIAGVYGTNFDNIPELHFKYGYYLMWGIILLTACSMILYFKRKKWF